ncbi:unnamed protein product [Polarella glacialis]|uniref:Uncharacterized protein n=1 Tax=Polarella glacialis TaxID=89957 RepID=A0A813FP95_POLGL|nr:unnamed protein product [Polarella glacialis]
MDSHRVRGFLCWSCALFLCWAALGFLHGGHWLLLGCALKEPGQRRLAWAHFASYWLGILMVAVGGSWVQSGTYIACNGGEDMSRTCLWTQQRENYKAIYTLHYIGLAWIVAHWVMDGFHLIPWAMHLADRKPLVIFCTNLELSRGRYASVIFVAVFFVTLTWTGFVNWNTAFGLDGLARILFAEILATLLAAVVVAQLVARKTCSGT